MGQDKWVCLGQPSASDLHTGHSMNWARYIFDYYIVTDLGGHSSVTNAFFWILEFSIRRQCVGWVATPSLR